MVLSILACVAAFVAGLVQGCTGFGFAMLLAPILLLFLPYLDVPPIVIILGLINNLIVLLETFPSVRFRIILPLLTGAVIGLPLGGYILGYADSAMFKLAVGVVVIAVSIAMFFGWKYPLKQAARGLVPIGFLSGLMSSGSSIGGPPVVLFFSNQGISKSEFRANIVAYFVLVNIGAIAVFWKMGILNSDVFKNAGLMIIPVVLGSMLGVYTSRCVDDKIFNKVVLVLIAALGVLLVAGGIGK